MDCERLDISGPVAIFGAGVTGRSVEKWIRQRGGQPVVFGEKPGETPFSFEQAARFSVVVYSPGFRPHHPWLAWAKAEGCICLSELDLAAAFWPGGPVWAVTGTNGKTTTTEALVHALRYAGHPAVASGNIGTPLLDLCLPGASSLQTVCEVSSFQAQAVTRFRPDALLWGSFAADHLDWHVTLDDYFAAKWRLVEQTTPAEVYLSQPIFSRAKSQGLSVSTQFKVLREQEAARYKPPAGSVFQEAPQSYNYPLMAFFWQHQGYSLKLLEESLVSFGLGPHRLAQVGQYDGITVWNDSKATNWDAALGAIARLGEGAVYWIGGGYDKQEPCEHALAQLAPRLQAAFTIGQTGLHFHRRLATHGVPGAYVGELSAAVYAAWEAAWKGPRPAHILFSPACSSQDQFTDYAHRGGHFQALCHQKIPALAVNPPEGRVISVPC